MAIAFDYLTSTGLMEVNGTEALWNGRTEW
jgi:hypothetical protein